MNLMRKMIILSLCLAVSPLGGAFAEERTIPELPWDKRSDWIDVKTDVTPAAKGDGIADDTDALQAAFRLMDWNSKTKTIFIPAGTYRITRTLELGGEQLKGGIYGGTIIGCGRLTRIVWDGEDKGAMIKSLGFTHSNYVGLMLDGRGKAATGILHAARMYETDMLYRHMAFLSFSGAAISIGQRHEGNLETAELLYDNCLFEHCMTGVDIGSWNDYNNAFNGCEFRDCGTGISESNGNAYIRDCHFERSSDCDIKLRSEHGSSVRRCTSTGSKQFLEAGIPISGMTVQDCQVEGWNDYAIKLSANAPLLLVDCVFTAGKAGSPPPVKFGGWQQTLLVSNCSVADGGELFLPSEVTPGPNCQNKLYLIPKGELAGVVKSARQSFLKTSVPMPGKIFDAKRDFGAKGDGKTDDADAIQKAIDAAKPHGKGALVYLPYGTYMVSKTLELNGSNYRFGGGGGKTNLEWMGPEGGTILHVSDPDNLSVEGLTIGGYPNSKNGNDILQTSSGKGASSIFYDRVSVLSPAYNPKWNFDYTKRGLRLEGLKKNDTVLVKYLRGNFRCVDSSAATILCNVSYNTGNIIVEGKSKDRDGFIGVMSKLGVCENPSLTVKDNNSIVVSDYYMESDVRFISLEGSPEDPAGRVTIQGAKIDRAPEFSEIPGIEINGYKGEFTLGPIQFYVSEPLKSIVAKSTGPLSVVYLCNFYYNCMPVFNIGTGIQLHKIGNRGRNDAAGFKEVLVDTEFEAAIPQISRAFDDLRRLGKIDMQLNHPGATAVEKRKNDANK